MPAVSYHRSLWCCVYICDVFKSLINSLVCWFYTDALGLFPFQILLLTVKLFWLLVCLGVCVCFKIKANYYMCYFLCIFRSKRWVLTPNTRCRNWRSSGSAELVLSSAKVVQVVQDLECASVCTRNRITMSSRRTQRQRSSAFHWTLLCCSWSPWGCPMSAGRSVSGVVMCVDLVHQYLGFMSCHCVGSCQGGHTPS